MTIISTGRCDLCARTVTFSKHQPLINSLTIMVDFIRDSCYTISGNYFSRAVYPNVVVNGLVPGQQRTMDAIKWWTG